MSGKIGWLLCAWACLNASAGDASPVELKIRLLHGRVIVPASLNHSGGSNDSNASINSSGSDTSTPFTFLLDSACTIPTVHPTVIDELGLKPSGRVRINGIAGLERAPTYAGLNFTLGTAQYAPSRVASIPSERGQARRRDGVLDSGFFTRFVIEIRPRENLLRLHAPATFVYTGGGTIVPFRFREEIPVVQASLHVGARVLEGEFEIDTGCDSGLCLGAPFAREHQLLAETGSDPGEKFGVGGSVSTRSLNLAALRLHDAKIPDVQTDLFLEGSPVDEPLAGHIGMPTLTRQTVFFDYARQRIILED